ncbi:MAG: hypothetical protein DMG02_17285 [Acidobacteria bacterium]|nr:MAG: hypothetical protein DMG02_17285 [Acidobacteriota bacterium]PYR07039.1 MAG: hypothetical protein DMF99_24315 [Acidobacteriota bacterium]
MTRGRHLEDSPNNSRLVVIDDALDVRPLAAGVEHVAVVISEHATTCDMARLRLPRHRIVGPLTRLLAF